ncbi:MAG: EAL domain-containing protein [Catonella sp.]
MSSIVVTFMSLFTILLCILSVCIYLSLKKKQPIAKNVRLLLIVTVVSIFIQAFLLFTKTVQAALIMHSVYLTSICFMRYVILKIAIEVTGHEIKNAKKFRFLYLVIIFDGILLVGNIFTKSLFIIEKVKIGQWYYHAIITQPLYTLHSIIAYGVVILTSFIIIYKIIGLSTVYWGKYLMLLFVFAGAVIISAIYRILNYAIDISIIAYALGVIATYVILLENKQIMLIDKMLSHIISKTDDIIVFLDIDNVCVYLNETAKHFFNIDDDYSSVIEQINKMFCLEGFDDTKVEYSALCSTPIKSQMRHFDILYKKLYRNGKMEGSYYKIKDKTIEIEIFNNDKYKATHDKLTGSYNGDYFCERVNEILADDPYTEYYMLCSDVKNFKLINDSFGKAVGDRVLNSIVWKLREKISKDTLYCRLSGDKFCVLIEKDKYDEKVFVELAKEISMEDGIHYPIHMQIGVYKIEDRSISASTMIDRAGMAIAENKEDYKNKIFYYDDRIRETKYWEQRLSGELDRAIEENQLKVYLQAQCNDEGKVIGAEALIRWLHPTEGMIPPYRFIEMFEKNGLISKVDVFVWNQVAKLLRKWKDEGKGEYYVSVNISPADFYFLDIYKEFTDLVTKYEIDPSRLKLEITETVIMKDVESRLMIVEKLRDFGFTVEMDDFGSGYSSLNMLKDISVDVIKLDMGFLYKTKDEEKSRKIIEMIVQLSKALDMLVVCEGVETKSQFEFLKSVKCDYFQGYLFAKPVSIEEFEKVNMKQER